MTSACSTWWWLRWPQAGLITAHERGSGFSKQFSDRCCRAPCFVANPLSSDAPCDARGLINLEHWSSLLLKPTHLMAIVLSNQHNRLEPVGASPQIPVRRSAHASAVDYTGGLKIKKKDTSGFVIYFL